MGANTPIACPDTGLQIFKWQLSTPCAVVDEHYSHLADMDPPRSTSPSKQTEAVYVSNLPYEYCASQLNDLLRNQELEPVCHLNSLPRLDHCNVGAYAYMSCWLRAGQRRDDTKGKLLQAKGLRLSCDFIFKR